LNVQLRTAIHWWIKQLRRPTFREIPLRAPSAPLVLSYSDGEGDDAGVGVAVWFPGGGPPEAGYLQVPEALRAIWYRQRGRGMRFDDIFQVEAVGPALILHQWGRRMRGMMWLHFIDNAGAQAALVNGSSSVHEGDIITGYVWEEIAHNRIFAWFDRVASQSNPVDKLSRGQFSGPWTSIHQMRLPPKLLARLQREL
jgi:hypothetical protein